MRASTTYWKVLVAVAATSFGCSHCSSNGGASDAGTDTDTDADADVDADADSDADSGLYTTDAGPWNWINNPDAGEDCGTGCQQLTFTDKVRAWEWDVWDKLLTWSDDRSSPQIHIVNIEFSKNITIPHPYGQDEVYSNPCFWPAVWNSKIAYSVGRTDSSPLKQELFVADIENQFQTRIWSREEPLVQDGYWGALIQNVDINSDIVISTAGCGTPTENNLCIYMKPYPSSGTALIDESYVFWVNMSESKVIFLDATTAQWDVRGYDLESQSFFEVTDDDTYQNNPRIGSNKVVWQDYRFSSGSPMESQDHTAIFAKDLDTGVVTQLTDGSAVVASPDVYGDVVVWLDWRNCADPQNQNVMDCAEVYGHNLATGVEARVTNLPTRPKATPRIWGDHAFVDMKTEAGNAIFMIDLPGELE